MGHAAVLRSDHGMTPDVARPAGPVPPATDLPDRSIAGLTAASARERLARDGPNELPTRESRGLRVLILEILREPMLFLLVAAGLLYLTMGNTSDALLLMSFVVVVITITVLQSQRAERALAALRDLSCPHAQVIRDGAYQRIDARALVVGDIILIGEGDRIPADALLRQSLELRVDESLLTGESVPVRKIPTLESTRLEPAGGEGSGSLFSGTLVSAGQGVCEVVATGSRTQMGQIGQSLARIGAETTPLQRESRRVVRLLAYAGLTACAFLIVIFALTRGGSAAAWQGGVLAGITMAMAILPEEIPVILTVFLAIGAWRIAQVRVLTRRLPAIEALGTTTVLCVDKTGTLTQNRMVVERAVLKDLSVDLRSTDYAQSPPLNELITTASLASRSNPFDPMDVAIRQIASSSALDQGADFELVREYPLTAERLAVIQIWIERSSNRGIAAAKGAPETMATLCRLDPIERRFVMDQVSALATQGLRVIGIARASITRDTLPSDPDTLGLQWLGLLGLGDPLRDDVPDAIADCARAGIRVVMITGDYPETALSIGRQAGITQPSKTITGPEIDRMNDQDLMEKVRHATIFARVLPRQKLRIIQTLKTSGEIVAMTGDGVNDAPALKAAHIGIAMGVRGTAVARESAALVLLDDSFSSIVKAIRMGRRIHDNIRKAAAFTIAVHIPIAGLSMMPVWVPTWPLLLLPIHIVVLELIIDPACSLVFEAESPEPDLMNRPPRDPNERLFSQRLIAIAALQGLSVLVACIAIDLVARTQHSTDGARALTFTSLSVALLGLILINRSWQKSAASMLKSRNLALRWLLIAAAIMLGAALTVAPLAAIFSFAPVPWSHLAMSAVAVLAGLTWFELLKKTRWWQHGEHEKRNHETVASHRAAD